MNNSGWIKIHRKILDWEWYDDKNTWRVFVHLLLSVNWIDGRWRGVTVPRGARVLSFQKLSKETRLSVQCVRTAIDKLLTTGEITKQTTNKYTLLSVCNYHKYQDYEHETNKQINKQTNKRATNEQQTSNKQVTTIEERKKDKKERMKEDKKYNPQVDCHFWENEQFQFFWKEWMITRKKKGCVFTDNALKLALAKMMRLSKGDIKTAMQILEQSILGGWSTLYALKENKAYGKQYGYQDVNIADSYAKIKNLDLDKAI